MSVTNILDLNHRNKTQKLLSVLIDPDKVSRIDLQRTVEQGNALEVDLWLIGGSQLEINGMSESVQFLKRNSEIPVVLFPGSFHQVDDQADAILFLSLLSGNNADFLIGHQKKAARKIQSSRMKVIPTAYILVDGGNSSSAAIFTETNPISMDDHEEIIATALTGKYFGMNTVYLEAGSGAEKSVEPRLVKMVKELQGMTVIVGGGIRTSESATALWMAGADMVVIGNILEKEIELLNSFIEARNSCR